MHIDRRMKLLFIVAIFFYVVVPGCQQIIGNDTEEKNATNITLVTDCAEFPKEVPSQNETQMNSEGNENITDEEFNDSSGFTIRKKDGDNKKTEEVIEEEKEEEEQNEFINQNFRIIEQQKTDNPDGYHKNMIIKWIGKKPKQEFEYSCLFLKKGNMEPTGFYEGSKDIKVTYEGDYIFIEALFVTFYNNKNDTFLLYFSNKTISGLYLPFYRDKNYIIENVKWKDGEDIKREEYLVNYSNIALEEGQQNGSTKEYIVYGTNGTLYELHPYAFKKTIIKSERDGEIIYFPLNVSEKTKHDDHIHVQVYITPEYNPETICFGISEVNHKNVVINRPYDENQLGQMFASPSGHYIFSKINMCPAEAVPSGSNKTYLFVNEGYYYLRNTDYLLKNNKTMEVIIVNSTKDFAFEAYPEHYKEETIYALFDKEERWNGSVNFIELNESEREILFSNPSQL